MRTCKITIKVIIIMYFQSLPPPPPPSIGSCAATKDAWGVCQAPRRGDLSPRARDQRAGGRNQATQGEDCQAQIQGWWPQVERAVNLVIIELCHGCTVLCIIYAIQVCCIMILVYVIIWADNLACALFIICMAASRIIVPSTLGPIPSFLNVARWKACNMQCS